MTTWLRILKKSTESKQRSFRHGLQLISQRKRFPCRRKITGATLAAHSWTWLYSGNLGRAHEWRPILLAQRELEDRALPIQLLFEGGGAMWMDAQLFAGELKLKNCRWCDYADQWNGLADGRLAIVLLIPTRVCWRRGVQPGPQSSPDHPHLAAALDRSSPPKCHSNGIRHRPIRRFEPAASEYRH